jgi:hypothetical protein
LLADDISVAFDPSSDQITYSNKIRFQRHKQNISHAMLEATEHAK